jgi:hypothetical protein
MICRDCGAPELTCETRFHEFLALEFENVDYGAVHHLTVAAYMLQHSRKLTRQGWLETRKLLREFLVENKPPSFIRQQNKAMVDSGKRKGNITSKDHATKIHKSTWKMTILDVRTDDAPTYCADVTAWAKSALEEAEAIFL